MRHSSILRTVVTVLLPAALMGLPGCLPDGAAAPDEIAGDDESSVASTRQEVAFWRDDQNGLFTPGEGFWGSWRQMVFCNPGMYATGYKMRVEGSQGSGDDTGLNSIQLFCSNPSTGASEWISSYDGLWGGWGASASCPGTGSFLNGARINIESPQGSGDDTAANDVNFTCSAGGTSAAPGGATWGSWSNWYQCPNNTAVCGFSIKFESSQGSGDDTAMNGLQVACCNLSGAPPATVALVPTMDSNTTPSGYVSRSGVYSSAYEAWQAFDATTSLWLSNMYTSSVWIGYQFGGGASRTVTYYDVSYANGSCCEQRGPKSWYLQGWNGSTWVTVDTVTNQTGWYLNYNRTFTVDSPGSYSSYRMLVTADNYNNPTYPITLVSISKIQLYGY